MRAAVQILREQDVQDLRAIYDTGHELLRQQQEGLQQQGLEQQGHQQEGPHRVNAHEILTDLGITVERARQLFDVERVTNEFLWSDLQADVQFIADSQPLRTSLADSFSEYAARLRVNDPVDNAWIAREIVRRATLVHGTRVGNRDVWELRTLSLEVDERSQPKDRDRLATLIRVDAVQRLRLLELYESILSTFGMRPAEPMTTAEFTAGAMSTLEGVRMHTPTHEAQAELMRATGPEGQLVPWNIMGAVFEAYVLASVEVDPFSAIAFDLSVWR